MKNKYKVEENSSIDGTSWIVKVLSVCGRWFVEKTFSDYFDAKDYCDKMNNKK